MCSVVSSLAASLVSNFFPSVASLSLLMLFVSDVIATPDEEDAMFVYFVCLFVCVVCLFVCLFVCLLFEK